MDIRTDLQTVTEEIAAARTALAEAEAGRLMARHNVNQAESNLTAARVALMARTDAGGNDHQRRAYADRETAAEREYLTAAESDLTDAELDVIEAAAALRIAEDRRRYLETMVALTTGRATELAIHASYAVNGNGQPSSVQPAADERVSFIDHYAPGQER